jgi:hypothetical protein
MNQHNPAQPIALIAPLVQCYTRPLSEVAILSQLLGPNAGKVPPSIPLWPPSHNGEEWVRLRFLWGGATAFPLVTLCFAGPSDV